MSPPRLAIRQALLREMGLEFDTDLPLPLLTEWSVTLTLPDQAKWVAQGVVVSCDPVFSGGWHVAIYFVHKEELREDVMAFSA